jgi:hypothetical protein
LACGWWTSHARQHRLEQTFILEKAPFIGVSASSRSPRWLRILDVTGELSTVFQHVEFVACGIPRDHREPTFELPPRLTAELPYLSDVDSFGVCADLPRNQNTPCPLRLGTPELAALRRIRWLTLRHHTADDETLLAVGQLINLENLSLEDAQVTDEGFAGLASCIYLQNLHLARCHGLTDKSIDTLLRLPQLKSVHIDYCNGLTAHGIARLSQIRTIEFVRLEAAPELAREVFSALNGKIPQLFVSRFDGT